MTNGEGFFLQILKIGLICKKYDAVVPPIYANILTSLTVSDHLHNILWIMSEIGRHVTTQRIMSEIKLSMQSNDLEN